MKMKRMLPLFILIGLLLAAAAAYLFLKKKNVSPPDSTGGEGGNSPKFLDLNDPDSVVDSLSLSGTLNKKAKEWAKNIIKWREASTGNWKKSTGLASAQDRGITYTQACVLDGLYQMYATQGLISKEQYHSLEDELESL